MGTSRPRPVVLDTGALIAFERHGRQVRELVELSITEGATLHCPAGVIAQVWRQGTRQARLARLLRSRVLTVRPLSLEEAQAVGILCGASATADIVDASVAVLARRHNAIVVTTDPDDLRRLDASLSLIVC